LIEALAFTFFFMQGETHAVADVVSGRGCELLDGLETRNNLPGGPELREPLPFYLWRAGLAILLWHLHVRRRQQGLAGSAAMRADKRKEIRHSEQRIEM
jgi:hypothetical protein